MSSSPSQGHVRERMRRSFGGNRFHRKCGADVRAGIDNETSVWRPRGIDRILADKKDGRMTVERNAEKVWDAVIVRGRGDRFAVRCPCWSALQIECIGHSPRVRTVGLHCVQESPRILAD